MHMTVNGTLIEYRCDSRSTVRKKTTNDNNSRSRTNRCKLDFDDKKKKNNEKILK